MRDRAGETEGGIQIGDVLKAGEFEGILPSAYPMGQTGEFRVVVGGQGQQPCIIGGNGPGGWDLVWRRKRRIG